MAEPTLQQAADFIGVDPNSSEEDVRAKYHEKARELHPDAGGTEEQMQDLNNAFDVFKAKFKEGKDVIQQKEAVQESRENYQEPNANEGSETKYQREETRTHHQSPHDDYEKAAPKWSQRESFYDSVKKRSGRIEDDFYSSVVGEVNRISRTNHVLEKFLREVRQRKGSVDQTDFVKALIRRAKRLTDVYFIDKEVNIMMDLEYRKSLKTSFLLVLAILNRVQTISGLDEELNLVRSEISTKAGIELWNELKQPGDLTYRMYAVRAILNGKKVEEVLEKFKENGRESLEEYINIEAESEHYKHYAKAA